MLYVFFITFFSGHVANIKCASLSSSARRFSDAFSVLKQSTSCSPDREHVLKPKLSIQLFAESCNPFEMLMLWQETLFCDNCCLIISLCVWLFFLVLVLLCCWISPWSSESKFVQFLLGYVYRGRCEILPCRAGSGPRPSAQPGNSLQRSQAREVWINSDFLFSLYLYTYPTTEPLNLPVILSFCVSGYWWFYLKLFKTVVLDSDSFSLELLSLVIYIQFASLLLTWSTEFLFLLTLNNDSLSWIYSTGSLLKFINVINLGIQRIHLNRCLSRLEKQSDTTSLIIILIFYLCILKCESMASQQGWAIHLFDRLIKCFVDEGFFFFFFLPMRYLDFHSSVRGHPAEGLPCYFNKATLQLVLNSGQLRSGWLR